MIAGIADEFNRVMRGNSVLHPVHGGRGGEWDVLRAAPRTVLRRLTGARMLTPYGLAPDQVAFECTGPYKGIEDVDDAMAWFLLNGILTIDERRRLAHFERHIKLARRHGCTTYFEYRDSLSRLSGYSSYYFERQERWPTQPSSPLPTFNQYLRTLKERGMKSSTTDAPEPGATST